MNPDELTSALSSLQPAILLAFEVLIASVEQIDPPEEHAADHQRYIQFLQERFELSRHITVAAQENRPDHLRDELFPQDEVITCSAFDDIDPDFLTFIGEKLTC